MGEAPDLFEGSEIGAALCGRRVRPPRFSAGLAEALDFAADDGPVAC